MSEPGDLLETDDPLQRFRNASSAIEDCRRRMAALAAIRGRALLELTQDRSVASIAEEFGVTVQQIYRLLREAKGRS